MARCLFPLLSLLSFTCCEAVPSAANVPDQMIMKLFNMIQDDHIENLLGDPKDPPYYRLPGLYTSFTKNNFHGPPSSAIGRKLGLFDNNLFTTDFISTMLLEAYERGAAPLPSSQQLEEVVGISDLFHDKNRPYNNSIMVFWVLVNNEDVDFWQTPPENMFKFLDYLKDYNQFPLAQAADILGFTDIAKTLKFFKDSMASLLSINFVPGDHDCTALNLGYGAALYRSKDLFPEAWQQWADDNTNLTSLFDAVKEYSYRPFSGDRDSSTIDPRSYFVYRHFIDYAKENGNDLALVTTWTQSLEEVNWQHDKGVAMPTNVNNVCLGVTSNVLYGTTSAILSGIVDATVLDDPLFAQIYHNSSALLSYLMATNITGRPDLAFLYYPSQTQVEWFMSRSLAKMKDALNKGPLPSPVMQEVHDILESSLKFDVTRRLIGSAQHDGEESCFYEEFLGTDDYSKEGTPVSTGEDRIFATAMALNVLLNTWTSLNPEQGTLHWDTDATVSVKTTAACAARWIVENALSGKYQPGGALFAGSHKWENMLPWFFPGNRYEHYNGTTIEDWDSQKPNHLTMFAMEGYVEPEEYNAMLDQNWFGYETPLDFQGYNSETDGFLPYWESEPFTYTITYLGLAMYKNIEN